MATLSLGTPGSTSIPIVITGITAGNNVAIYRPVYGSSDKNPVEFFNCGTTLSTTITGLSPSTTYSIRADINYQGSGAVWVPPLSQTYTFTTAAAPTTPAPYLEFESATTDSISFWLHNAIVGNTAMINYRPTSASADETVQEPVNCRVTSFLITIGGLEPGTAYYISVDRAYGGEGTGDDWTARYEMSTKAIALPRPSDWAWETVVASEAKINLTASEWNNFCARILAFAKYVGSKDNGDYTYSLDTVYTGDYITATLVNKARSAISIIPGHGTLPSRVSAEAYIYASFFNELKDALNAIP